MRVAIIGIGYWGIKHVEEYIDLGHDVIICDPDEKNISICKKKFKSITIQSLESILSDKNISCVSICTPNNTHFEIAKKCLESQKHVFLEKPISTNLIDAEKLIEISTKRKLILQIGHLYRFNNSIFKAKQLVDDDELGTIHSVYFSWNNFEKVFTDRGIIIDLGIHPVDIVNYIFDGSSENIKCRGWGIRQKNPEFAIISYKQIQSKNQSIFINIELSWINPIKKRELIIIGDKKSLRIQCVTQKISLIDNSSKEIKEISIIPNNTIRDELEFFINSCKHNQTIPPPYPNAIVAKNILEIILEAEIKNSDKK